MANYKTHCYQIQVLWTGNMGQGTSSYKGYERSHQIIVEGKPSILGLSIILIYPAKIQPPPKENEVISNLVYNYDFAILLKQYLSDFANVKNLH